MRRELTRVNGYFEVTIPAYLSGEFENHFPDYQGDTQLSWLLTQEIMHTAAGRIPRELTLGRETKPDISCKWNAKFSIIPESPSKRVHSKRIPKFSKTFPGLFTFPCNFGPEISKFLVQWKAPQSSKVSRIERETRANKFNLTLSL